MSAVAVSTDFISSPGPDGGGVYAQLTAPTSPKGPATLYLSTGLSAPLGSLVYAMPRLASAANPKNSVISTNLFLDEPSIELATRVASTLATKLHRPVFVASNVPSSAAASGFLTLQIARYVTSKV